MEIKFNEKEQAVIEFLTKKGVSLEDIIDVTIKSNRIIGVGLISLADRIRDYIEAKIPKG